MLEHVRNDNPLPSIVNKIHIDLICLVIFAPYIVVVHTVSEYYFFIEISTIFFLIDLYNLCAVFFYISNKNMYKNLIVYPSDENDTLANKNHIMALYS